MTPMTHTRLALGIPLVLVSLLACSADERPATAPGDDRHAAHSVMITESGTQLTGQQLAWIGRLRREAIRWRDASAVRGIWETELGCMEDETSGQGGMGIHLLDADRLTAPVDEMRPEALMYEPQADGSLKLVGVEFVKSRAAFTSAPNIRGVEYHAHPNGALWILHVWIAEHNPTGIMKDWNPRVKCPAP